MFVVGRVSHVFCVSQEKGDCDLGTVSNGVIFQSMFGHHGALYKIYLYNFGGL